MRGSGEKGRRETEAEGIMGMGREEGRVETRNIWTGKGGLRNISGERGGDQFYIW